MNLFLKTPQNYFFKRTPYSNVLIIYSILRRIVYSFFVAHWIMGSFVRTPLKVLDRNWMSSKEKFSNLVEDGFNQPIY